MPRLGHGAEGGVRGGRWVGVRGGGGGGGEEEDGEVVGGYEGGNEQTVTKTKNKRKRPMGSEDERITKTHTSAGTRPIFSGRVKVKERLRIRVVFEYVLYSSTCCIRVRVVFEYVLYSNTYHIRNLHQIHSLAPPLQL